MALNLTVPALDDKPLIVAETRPQKILEFIAQVPPAPLDAASAILDEMEILNRQKVPADNRIKSLEIYRSHIISLTGKLSDIYHTDTLPLPKQAKTYAAAAESLWLELSYGYKLALSDQLSQIFNPGNQAIALSIHRTMDCLYKLSMVYYETYANIPGSVWRDLHQMYYYAAQQGLHEVEVPSANETSSINLLYKQILLMSLADPRHLTAQDMQWVDEYITRFAKHTQLQDLGVLENPTGVSVVCLNSDKPPMPYGKNTKPTDGRKDILFITVDLARLAHQHLQMLQSGDIVENSDLPASIHDARYEDLLVCLIKQWGVAPKRMYNRSIKNNIAQLGVGLDATFFFINHAKHYLPPVSADTTIDPSYHTNKAQGIPEASNWQVLNISAGGTALRKFPTVSAQVRIGELLSIKNNGERTWAVAVLRWANNSENDQLDIGVQLIAPSAKVAGVRILNSDRFEGALILPAMAAIKQAPSLITRCGLYAPARVLELDENGTLSRMMITKLVERTKSFERFQFTVL